MKVSLRKEDETSGLIFKKPIYAMYLKVQLTPEERNAIKKAGIEDYVLLDYEVNDREFQYQVKSVVYDSDKNRETRFTASDAIKRRNMEETIKEQLSILKSNIDAQLEGGSGSETFDL